MGKKELKNVARTKDRLKDIMKLRKEKEYDKIFEIYGQNIYKLAVPDKYKKKEIKDLMKEGRFEDIYRKYGERTYNNYIYAMQQTDVYNETGNKPKSILNRIKNVLLRRVAPVALSTALIAPPSVMGVLELANNSEEKKNSIEYALEIEEYNKNINSYAKEIKDMNLNDMQIFMKVMSDMWKEIDGYAEPENDITGYLRITLDNEKVGVCRHFSDDITAKLNAINPEYNARNIVVHMDDSPFVVADIERHIINSNETVAGENEQSDSNFDITNLMGNHMVTAVDVPNENITLVLDPTNPGIGVFKDGKIYMFSTSDGKGITTKKFGQAFWGLSDTIELVQTEMKSFLPCKYDLEELENMYGTVTQNETLKQLEILEQQKENSDFVPKVNVDSRIAVQQFQERGENNINKDIDLEK